MQHWIMKGNNIQVLGYGELDFQAKRFELWLLGKATPEVFAQKSDIRIIYNLAYIYIN